jgi:uncharacterized protein (TIGR00106 family)
MSVLMEFAMFPTDKGSGGVSEYVSKVIEMIRNSGQPYKLTAMGTIIETQSIEDSLKIVQKSYDILEPISERIFATIKFDIRKNRSGRIDGKISSIEDKIGKVNK